MLHKPLQQSASFNAFFYFDPDLCGMFFWHYDHVLLVKAQSCKPPLVSVRSFYASGQNLSSFVCTIILLLYDLMTQNVERTNIKPHCFTLKHH